MSEKITIEKSIVRAFFWSATPFSPGQAFIDLLILADSGGTVTCSQKFLSERFGWSRQKVSRFLARLVSERFILHVKSRPILLIKILNFDQYAKRLGIKRAKDGQGAGHKKNEIHEKLRLCLARRPDVLDFLVSTINPTPEAQGRWIKRNEVIEVCVEIERFRDYLLAYGKRYKDYQAAFNNWLINPLRKRDGKNRESSNQYNKRV